MKAVVYDRSIPGALSLRQVEKPAPGRGEVLVRVCATSVNAADYRTMGLGMIPKKRIFCTDVAGVAEAAGKVY